MSLAEGAGPLLSVRDLVVRYGNVVAVQGVTLNVMPGRIVTVIGPNGAGKTTLLSAIMGQLGASGDIAFAGKSQMGRSIQARVADGMTLVPEKRELFSTMSVEDNLRLGAYARYLKGEGDFRQSLQDVYGLFPRLQERKGQAAGTLSGGERAMLVLGRALMAKPKLLLLDEPSLGLAPLIVKTIFQIIAGLRQSGVSILLVEQNARAALGVSDYAYVLEMGTIAIEGEAAALANDPRVAATYLGGTLRAG
jgi:branched-chain amino acid transport system ATP-binding protein